MDKDKVRLCAWVAACAVLLSAPSRADVDPAQRFRLRDALKEGCLLFHI